MKILKKSSEKQAVSAPKTHYKSLDEVMDKTVPFCMIYSGVENSDYLNLLYDEGITDFLMSYHYLQKRKVGLGSLLQGKKVKLMIDSGAHTYMQDVSYADTTVEQWEEHLKKYLAWAKRNREYIRAIVNFDFEELVGAEQVDIWN